MDRKYSISEVVGEIVAFARPQNWLVSKIPPLLAVAYLAIFRFGIDPADATRFLVCGMVSIFCVALYSSFGRFRNGIALKARLRSISGIL